LWLDEQRTTRPLQWTRTSWGVPRTERGIRMENWISRPTRNALSNTNRTPLAEMFRVRAAMSPSTVDSTTGSARGNRTAQRTSCHPTARGAASDGTGTFGLRELIHSAHRRSGSFANVADFAHLAQGTKVFRQVTTCGPSSQRWGMSLPTHSSPSSVAPGVHIELPFFGAPSNSLLLLSESGQSRCRSGPLCAMPQCQQVEVKLPALSAQSAHVGEEKSKTGNSNLCLVTFNFKN